MFLRALDGRVDAVAKNLEVYSGDAPPPDYSLGTEVGGILREADAHGFDRFHLVGYSGGGAASLAFAAAHGERVLSLTLLEPAWAGNERTPAEEAVAQRFRALEPLPTDQFMAGWRSGWPRSSPTSASRRSRSGTTSTRPTGSSQHGSPTPCSHSGSARRLERVRLELRRRRDPQEERPRLCSL